MEGSSSVCGNADAKQGAVIISRQREGLSPESASPLRADVLLFITVTHFDDAPFREENTNPIPLYPVSNSHAISLPRFEGQHAAKSHRR